VNISDLEKLKALLEQEKQKANKAEGAKEQLMARLKSEFGLSSVDEAEKCVLTLEQAVAEDQKKQDELLKQLEELTNWGLGNRAIN